MNHTRWTITTLAVALIAVLGACKQQSPPDDDDAQADVATTADTTPGNDGVFDHGNWAPSTDPTRITVDGLVFTKPATWIETQPISAMRHSNYSVPGRSGEEAAELAVFVLPASDQIDLEDLVEQWQMLFQPDADGLPPAPLRMQVQAGDAEIPLIKLTGSYRRSGAPWFTPGQAMLAAVCDGDTGRVILRFSGPAGRVEAQQAAFLAVIESQAELAENEQSGSADGR